MESFPSARGIGKSRNRRDVGDGELLATENGPKGFELDAGRQEARHDATIGIAVVVDARSEREEGGDMRSCKFSDGFVGALYSVVLGELLQGLTHFSSSSTVFADEILMKSLKR